MENYKKPKSTTSFKDILGFAVVVFIAVVIYNNYNSGGNTEEKLRKKVETAIKNLTPQETQEYFPNEFIYIDVNYKQNFWGTKFNINCKLTNKATLISYKDVVLKITQYTKTNTPLGNDNHTIYEVFPLNSSKTIEFAMSKYDNASKIGVEVIGAQIYK